jgi:hypothetical protein
VVFASRPEPLNFTTVPDGPEVGETLSAEVDVVAVVVDVVVEVVLDVAVVVVDVEVVVEVVVDEVCDVELEVVVVVEVVVEAEVVMLVVSELQIMFADPWLAAWVESPMYWALIANVPSELGMSVIAQVPDTRLQLESTLEPSEDGPLKRTNPVGTELGVTMSLTVAVQTIEEPTGTADGEQVTVVEVGSCTASVRLSELAA